MLLFFVARNFFLQYGLNKIQQKIKLKYNTELSVGNCFFSGFSTVNVEKISLTPVGAGRLFDARHIEIDLSIWKIITGKLPYKKLSIDSAHLQLIKTDSADNFRRFIGSISESADTNALSHNIGYGTVLNNLLNKTFNILSGEVYVTHFSASYNSDSLKRFFLIPSLALKSSEFELTVIDSSIENPAYWNMHGEIDKQKRNISCHVSLHNNLKQLIPLISAKSEMKYQMDSMDVEIKSGDYNNEKLQLTLAASFCNLKINHWRIAPNDVGFDSLKFTGRFIADDNKMEFDRTSVLQLNRIKFLFSSLYNRSNGKNYALELNMPEMIAQDFFESLPSGMFSSFKGIKTNGALSFHLDFDLNKSMPDSVQFNAELKKKDFRIVKYGEEYLPKINSSFSYTAYNDFGPVRTFNVGPENPDFTPLGEISDYLKNAVLTSEDGSFYGHRGFNEDAFRSSIADNVRQGRFARGGSTISMQLVKNVFLSRNKTISRKAEEALIVWIIENNYLVSKDRMYEVYLNIIEWGPNVYGIKEAARFYFAKKPSELDLAESVYLASIVPRPKYFKYSFDSLGNLKPFLQSYYKLIADHLLRKEKITQPEYDGLLPTVRLKGPALQFIIPTETIPSDSLSTDDLDNM